MIQPKWYSWKPKGLDWPARLAYVADEKPEMVLVVVQVTVPPNDVMTAKFRFLREDLQLRRPEIDEFILAELRKQTSKHMVTSLRVVPGVA